MDDAVLEFSKFTAIPAVGSADEVTCDALQAVDVVTMALGTLVEVFGCILVAAIHTAVAVMVHRTVAHVVFVHQINHVRNGLGVVGSVTVNLHIENVSTAC